MGMNLSNFIGKDHRYLENAYRFTHYLELEDRLTLGRNQDQKSIVDAFLRFVDDRDITVVKTDNGVMEEVVDVSQYDIREQLLLLENNKGFFYDDDLAISYAFVGDDFFAYVLSNMLMLSGDKDTVQRMAKILDDLSLKYVETALRPDVNIIERAQQRLQLKITLGGIEPKIWRRFVVDDSLTFHELHQIIQRVMGWGNYHAYEFMVDKVRIEGEGDAGYCVDLMWRSFRSKAKTVSAATTMIKDFLKKEKQKFTYLYDLGDCWKHSVVVEKILLGNDEQCPLVLDGARICPPEDCGGVHGYKELLEIQKDRSHPLYQERIMEWLGGPFDPEYFDVERVNKSLRTGDFENAYEIFDERGTKISQYTGLKMRKLGRNEPCHCGSGKKYKKCCLQKDLQELGKPVRVREKRM